MRKTISVLDFIKTGRFGGVYLGQTMADIKNILSKPDDVTEIREDTAPADLNNDIKCVRYEKNYKL